MFIRGLSFDRTEKTGFSPEYLSLVVDALIQSDKITIKAVGEERYYVANMQFMDVVAVDSNTSSYPLSDSPIYVAKKEEAIITGNNNKISPVSQPHC